MDGVRGEVAPRGGGEGECVEEMGVCPPPHSHKVPPSPASGSCLSGAVGA